MGCCSSTSKTSKPKKVNRNLGTETLPEVTVVQAPPIERQPSLVVRRADVDLSVSEEPKVVIKNKKGAADLKATVETEVEKVAPTQPVEAEPVEQKLSKAQHEKLVVFVKGKYENVCSQLNLLHHNLKENPDLEHEELEPIVQNIKSDNKDIQNFVEEISQHPFENDKQFFAKIANLNKTVQRVATELDKSRKKRHAYSDFRKGALTLLRQQHPDIFEVADQEESTPKVTRRRKIPDNVEVEMPQKVNQYDEALDRELKPVMVQQRNEAAYKLEDKVKEYNRLLEDMGRLKVRHDAQQNGHVDIQKEVRNMKEENFDLAYNNDGLNVENETWNAMQGRIVEDHNNLVINCLQAQDALELLQQQYEKNRVQGEQMSQDYATKVKELEKQLFERGLDAKRLEKDYQCNMKRLFAKSEDIQQAREGKYQDQNYRVEAGLPAYDAYDVIKSEIKRPEIRPLDIRHSVSPADIRFSIREPAYTVEQRETPATSEFVTELETIDTGDVVHDKMTRRLAEMAKKSFIIEAERARITNERSRSPFRDPATNVIMEPGRSVAREEVEVWELHGVSKALDEARIARVENTRDMVGPELEAKRIQLQYNSPRKPKGIEYAGSMFTTAEKSGGFDDQRGISPIKFNLKPTARDIFRVSGAESDGLWASGNRQSAYV